MTFLRVQVAETEDEDGPASASGHGEIKGTGSGKLDKPVSVGAGGAKKASAREKKPSSSEALKSLPRSHSDSSDHSHHSQHATPLATRSSAVWLTRKRAGTPAPAGGDAERSDSSLMDAAPLMVRGVLNASFWSEDRREERMARVARIDEAVADTLDASKESYELALAPGGGRGGVADGDVLWDTVSVSGLPTGSSSLNPTPCVLNPKP